MAKKKKIQQLHEQLNDVLADLNTIQVADEGSREAKQEAILTLVGMRRTMERMGLHHAPMNGDR